MASLHAPSLASETIAHLGSFEIRNSLLMAWLAVGVLCLMTLAYRRAGSSFIPGRMQAFFELIIGGTYDFFASIVGNEKQARSFFPLVVTIFLFLVVGNWMGILPGVGSIFIEAMHNGKLTEVPLFRSMNADVNMTLAVAIVAMGAAQIMGMRQLGTGTYLGKFFVAPWKGKGIQGPIQTFVGLLEIIGELSRVISFTFRLFGNIFAGEVLLMVVSFLAPYIVPIPFLGLELFVGLIQALVFAMLTLVFLKMAVMHHGGEEHDHVPRHAALS